MGIYAGDIKPTKPQPNEYADYLPAAEALLTKLCEGRGIQYAALDPKRTPDMAYGLKLFAEHGHKALGQEWTFYAKAFPSGVENTPDRLFSMYRLDDKAMRQALGVPEREQAPVARPAPAPVKANPAVEKARAAGYTVTHDGMALVGMETERRPTSTQLAAVLKKMQAMGIEKVLVSRGEGSGEFVNRGTAKKPDWDVSGYCHTLGDVDAACRKANGKELSR